MKKVLVAALVAWPLAGAAQMYRWVDEYGQVHYTQEKPRSGKYETARPAPPPAASPNQDALNQSLDKAIKEAPKKKQEADQAAAAQAQREQDCQSFKDQLALLEANGPHRTTTTDANGNVSRTTEEEFNQRRSQLQQAVKDKCG